VVQPLRHVGRYDLAASDLPSSARTLGCYLAIRQDLLRTPPPETLFLHRKPISSFLTLAHIKGARRCPSTGAAAPGSVTARETLIRAPSSLQQVRPR
jgi:hypothetical protein